MAKKYRVKCPRCGEVTNLLADGSCPKCREPLSTESQGMLMLYRMGNFIGSAAGFGLYINGQPYGAIGNRENLRIPLPYGKYTLHIVCGLSRKCNDPEFELTPADPAICLKVHMRMGVIRNSFIIERVDPSTMPAD